MTRRKAGVACMALGALLLIGAALLIVQNQQEETRANQAATAALTAIKQELAAENPSLIVPGANATPAPKATEAPVGTAQPVIQPTPIPEMPTLMIDGQAYIGYIELPTLGLSLPVRSQWSYAALKTAPCRYWGSVYDDSMVILAHNYDRHFGRLVQLGLGDPVQLIDAEGKLYQYQVAETEILEMRDVEEMVENSFDLTLFTCTKGGKTRMAVRLNRAKHVQ